MYLAGLTHATEWRSDADVEEQVLEEVAETVSRRQSLSQSKIFAGGDTQMPRLFGGILLLVCALCVSSGNLLASSLSLGVPLCFSRSLHLTLGAGVNSRGLAEVQPSGARAEACAAQVPQR